MEQDRLCVNGKEYIEEWNFENWGKKYWSKTPDFLKYVEENRTRNEGKDV